MRIYTKTGDGGETGLLGGTRVPKDDPRVAAYGDVDETCAALGAVRVLARGALDESLLEVQRDLLAIGAQLADPTSEVATRREKATVTDAQVRRLEATIDTVCAQLPDLRSFVLPGGTATGAALHQARAVCRRAERSVVTLARTSVVPPPVVAYLNRLSDLLFVLARLENQRAGIPEDHW